MRAYGLYRFKSHPAIYPVATACFFAFCAALFTVDEYGRVFPERRAEYLALKFMFSASGIGFAFWFFRRGASDLTLGLFAATVNLYVLAFMWYAPLYEMAYLQGSIAASFFRFRRGWIFPCVFGLGLAGILVTYHLQDSSGWRLPAETRSDWVLISLIMFLVSALVQRFATGHTSRERERLERLSALGHDAVRILHDVKGLSSTPFLMSQRVKNADDLKDLTTSLEKVQNFLRATQRLVNVRENTSRVQLVNLAGMVVEILDARLEGVAIELPARPVEIICNPNRMFSVFYNVLLILGENFTSSGDEDRRIFIIFENGKIVISDNNEARSVESVSAAQDLRARVIASDLRNMNWVGGFLRGDAANSFVMRMA